MRVVQRYTGGSATPHPPCLAFLGRNLYPQPPYVDPATMASLARHLGPRLCKGGPPLLQRPQSTQWGSIPSVLDSLAPLSLPPSAHTVRKVRPALSQKWPKSHLRARHMGPDGENTGILHCSRPGPSTWKVYQGILVGLQRLTPLVLHSRPKPLPSAPM